jgi:hypothetical protein
MPCRRVVVFVINGSCPVVALIGGVEVAGFA